MTDSGNKARTIEEVLQIIKGAFDREFEIEDCIVDEKRHEISIFFEDEEGEFIISIERQD